MIYILLFITFVKVGLFSFGGGYAMIPLIQREIELNGWLSTAEFVDIISIAEMTPGPIAVNSATFVGYKVAGIFGGLIATAGVATPSFFIIMLVSSVFFKFQKHPLSTALFYGIRPVILGLIVTAALFVAETVLFKKDISVEFFISLACKPLQAINLVGIAIFLLSLLALVKFKLHPVFVIIVAGILGIALF